MEYIYLILLELNISLEIKVKIHYDMTRYITFIFNNF